jgi:hypothetical protein
VDCRDLRSHCSHRRCNRHRRPGTCRLLRSSLARHARQSGRGITARIKALRNVGLAQSAIRPDLSDISPMRYRKHANLAAASGLPACTPGVKGNPAKIRNCPAAVSRNERHHQALILTDWEAMASRSHKTPASPKTCRWTPFRMERGDGSPRGNGTSGRQPPKQAALPSLRSPS